MIKTLLKHTIAELTIDCLCSEITKNFRLNTSPQLYGSQLTDEHIGMYVSEMEYIDATFTANSNQPSKYGLTFVKSMKIIKRDNNFSSQAPYNVLITYLNDTTFNSMIWNITLITL